MFIEKKRLHIAPRAFTANGSIHGLVQIANTRGFYVKQKVTIKSSTQPPLLVEIKRFDSLTSFYVGPLPPQGKIGDRIDISAYLVADGATIEAVEQDRPGITIQEHERAVYVEEPVVAKRVISVDQDGRYYDTTNPVPVRLSDGSVNIGTVNAELEVQLSHKDNDPDAGDVHDSVRVGDGTDVLDINPDGSINVVPTAETLTYQVINLSTPLANTDYALALPADIRRFTVKVRDSKAVLKIYDAPLSPDYISISRGAAFDSGPIKNTSLSVTLQVSQPSCIVEVFCWVLGP